MKYVNTQWLKEYWLFVLTLLVVFLLWFTHTNHKLFFIINSYHDILPDSFWKAIIDVTHEKNGLLAILLLIITCCFRRDKILNVILLICVYYVIFYVIKIAVHEARPYMQYNPLTFHWLSQDGVLRRAYRSFPSGHTGNMAIFIFTLSRLFAQNKLWLRIVLLILLVLTMLAQICTGWHFPIDVLASALIGFILVAICFSQYVDFWIHRVKNYRRS